MTRIIAVMGMGLSLAGCGASAANWNKPGTSLARTERDIAECKYEAQLATPQSRGDPIAAGLSDGLRQVDLRNQCLQIRGYRQR